MFQTQIAIRSNAYLRLKYKARRKQPKPHYRSEGSIRHHDFRSARPLELDARRPRMKPNWTSIGAGILALTLSLPSLQGEETKPLPLGDSLRPFQLSDFRGRDWKSEEFGKSQLLALVFVGTECPLVKLYTNELNQLTERYAESQLQVVGINSNTQDSMTELEHFIRDNQVEFPILKDLANRVADQLGATRTPEVFLFDANRKLRYHGKIDDRHSYGQTRQEAKHHFLSDAIDELLSGKLPRVATQPPEGCIIGRVKTPNQTGSVTFANQVSRILQKNCVTCHRPGEIAPFSLTDYDEVVGWAEMIGEVVRDQRMPPWHANPDHGEFKNDARLSETDKKLLDQWIADGAPLGDISQLPSPAKHTEGWQIGTPDLIIPMSKRPFDVPATGVMPYEYFVVDPGFKEDKWVQAAECRAGNRSVVHHIVLIAKKRGRSSHAEIDSKWVTATAPGAPPLELPEGHAKLIPAGSKLVFQMHYTPNGTATRDLSRVGFIFADPASVTKVVGTQEIRNQRFRIPPGADNHEVRANYQARKNLQILSLFPHMHLRGKSFRYVAHWPNGEQETLLDIPNYDFNWQNGYHFTEPRYIPAGTRIECIAHFDNSENNFSNPDPNKSVRWGDQTFEEMMIGYFDCVIAAENPETKSQNPRTDQFLTSPLSRNTEGLKPGFLQLANQSINHPSKMKQFGGQLRKRLPQLDRVCWTAIENGNIRVERVAQTKDLADTLLGEGLEQPSKTCKLGELAFESRPTKLTRIDKINRIDMQHFSKRLKSSFHVPIEIEGRRGTINFWSLEADGFPQEAQELLVEISRAMAK